MDKYLKPILITVIGVVVAGLVIGWGYENDVPILKEAANGFDN